MVHFASRLRWLLLCALALLLACSSPREAPLARGATVLVLGDSISAGHTVGEDKAWVNHLATHSGWVMVNGGVSGDTSAQALARLPALLEEHRPAAVLIELGGNDLLRRQSLDTLRANLQSIIGQTRTAGARPILMAIPKPSIAGAALRNLSDHPIYAELAEAAGVPLIDEVISEVLSRAEWKVDALHPSIEGHQELARRVGKKLRALGLIAS